MSACSRHTHHCNWGHQSQPLVCAHLHQPRHPRQPRHSLLTPETTTTTPALRFVLLIDVCAAACLCRGRRRRELVGLRHGFRRRRAPSGCRVPGLRGQPTVSPAVSGSSHGSSSSGGSPPMRVLYACKQHASHGTSAADTCGLVFLWHMCFWAPIDTNAPASNTVVGGKTSRTRTSLK